MTSATSRRTAPPPSTAHSHPAGKQNPAYLSTEAVARQLGVDPSTVRRWIDDGRLPAVKPGRHYRVDQGDLAEFLRVSSTSRPLTLRPGQ